jgi:formylglycine-generating enzyme required for sulfatase activity
MWCNWRCRCARQEGDPASAFHGANRILAASFVILTALAGASLAVEPAPADAPPDERVEPQPARFPTMKNSLGMTLAYIPAGEFMMGTSEAAETLTQRFKEKPELVAAEYPAHRVRISNAFYMSTCEVTVGQFAQFVEATGYKTDAERDEDGGWGFDPATKKWGANPSTTGETRASPRPRSTRSSS